MPSTKKLLLTAAAGSAGDDNLFPEDVFSTYVYGAAHGTSPIVNGINFADEGGMVWFKHRTATYSNILFDTERGKSNHIVSNSTAANSTSIGLASFNTNGFSFSGVNLNINSASHVAWSFRKAEGFFDIQTWTGNGTAGKVISHNLNSVPKMIIVKRTDTTGEWRVYHVSLGNDAGILLNSTGAAGSYAPLNNTTPTSSQFVLNNNANVNANGGTYVAYLFGDDAVFGEDGDEQICKMGTFTTDGSGEATVTLGFEPQFVILKKSSGDENWIIADIMRGIPTGGNDSLLEPNTTAAETSTFNGIDVTSTGFTIQNFNSNSTYLYMAIRRPMKVPEAGTEVFAPVYANNSVSSPLTGFPVDFTVAKLPAASQAPWAFTRMLGETYLRTDTTGAAAATGIGNQFDFMNTVDLVNWMGAQLTASWNFKRAAKFHGCGCLHWDKC